MAAFLSTDWLEARIEPAAAGLAAAGASVRVQFVVTGGPDGEVRYGTVSDAGSVATTAGALTDPDLTCTNTYADAVAILTGDLTPNVAYMRGRTKVVGHTGRLLDLLSASQGDDYDRARTELAASTDLG